MDQEIEKIQEKKEAKAKYKAKDNIRVFHVKRSVSHLYVGFFSAFGWQLERTEFRVIPADSIDLYFSHPYSHCNHPDILKLQRKFESVAGEIEAIEDDRTKAASRSAIIVGLMGIVFVVGALVAWMSGTTVWAAFLLLLGAGLSIGSLFCYAWILKKQTMETEASVWDKYEDLYRLREEAGLLMQN